MEQQGEVPETSTAAQSYISPSTNPHALTEPKTIRNKTKSMPGPKMGNRPVDFDERIVRMAPTFKKWMALEDGQKLRYACRDFVKGKGNDEERLMRRIMIARRNNLRDHELLKKARNRASATSGPLLVQTKAVIAELKAVSDDQQKNFLTSSAKNKSSTGTTGGLLGPLIRKRPRTTNGMTDLQVKLEMDELAVESTRSYKAWLSLEDGVEFTYNQTYIKGKEGHDWLLKKNIWRRMRYRRQNKQMVEKMKGKTEERTDATLFQSMSYLAPNDTSEHFQNNDIGGNIKANEAEEIPEAIKLRSELAHDTESSANTSAMDAAVAAAASVGVGSQMDLVNNAIVEAAVAAAVSYVKDMPKGSDIVTSDDGNLSEKEISTLDGTTHAAINPGIAAGVSAHDGAELTTETADIQLKIDDVQSITMV